MGIEEQNAVRYITGSLSPNVQQAVARAKDVAQRGLPPLQMGKTDVTLVIDPQLRLVVDRVTDVDTGTVISLLPSSEPSPFAERSPQISAPDEVSVAQTRQIAESTPADRSVATSVQVVESRYREAGKKAEIAPEHHGKTLLTV